MRVLRVEERAGIILACRQSFSSPSSWFLKFLSPKCLEYKLKLRYHSSTTSEKLRAEVSIFSILCSPAEWADCRGPRQGQAAEAEDLSAPLSQNFPLIIWGRAWPSFGFSASGTPPCWPNLRLPLRPPYICWEDGKKFTNNKHQAGIIWFVQLLSLWNVPNTGHQSL